LRHDASIRGSSSRRLRRGRRRAINVDVACVIAINQQRGLGGQNNRNQFARDADVASMVPTKRLNSA
jgi:hypothetical protein